MSQGSTNTQILIVDDTVKNLQVLGTILRENEYQVIVATNGIQALQSAETSLPDLILLDVMMPEIDGYETCRRLKENPITQEVPIIFLTAKVEAEDIVYGFELGAVDYIAKPFNTIELLARVRNHLDLKFSKEKLTQEIEMHKATRASLQKSYQTIKSQQEKMLDELEQARKTQMSLLPDQIPAVPQTQIACKYVPMEQIGGDFYNIFPIADDQFGVLIADVTGHGVSAALIAFLVSGVFHNSVGAGSPELVVRLTNGYLDQKIQSGKFATMFYMTYYPVKRTLTYTSAGHPPALVIRSQTHEIIQLNTKGFPIGVFNGTMANFEEKTFQLLPGDKVLVYTDGIFEMRNEQNRILGFSQFLQFLEEKKQLPIAELIEQIYQLGQGHSNGSGNQDDITLVGLEVESEQH